MLSAMSDAPTARTAERSTPVLRPKPEPVVGSSRGENHALTDSELPIRDPDGHVVVLAESSRLEGRIR